MTASDIRLEVVVICELNLSLQFVRIFTFSLLQVFTLAHALRRHAFLLLRRFAFWVGYFKLCFARPILKRNNDKA